MKNVDFVALLGTALSLPLIKERLDMNDICMNNAFEKISRIFNDFLPPGKIFQINRNKLHKSIEVLIHESGEHCEQYENVTVVIYLVLIVHKSYAWNKWIIDLW